MRIWNMPTFVKKTHKNKFQKKFFPKGGLNPRTLDLKFTALTTRPKELTQDIDKNDGTKLCLTISVFAMLYLKISVFDFWMS